MLAASVLTGSRKMCMFDSFEYLRGDGSVASILVKISSAVRLSYLNSPPLTKEGPDCEVVELV